MITPARSPIFSPSVSLPLIFMSGSGWNAVRVTELLRKGIEIGMGFGFGGVGHPHKLIDTARAAERFGQVTEVK